MKMNMMRAMEILDDPEDNDFEDLLAAAEFLLDEGYCFTLPGRYGRACHAILQKAYAE